MDYSKEITKVKKSIAKVFVTASEGPQRVISVGTGFVLNKQNIVVTCNHVIEDPHRSIFLRFSGEEQYINARIAIRDVEHDLALLKFDGTIKTPLKKSTENVQEGMEVFYSGYPLDLENLTTHQGIISSISQDPLGNTTYLIDGTVNPGNSGCPLMTKKGMVIGVVNASQRESSHVLDKVEDMKTGAISLYNVDLISIYKALMKNMQLGIGYAVPASYIPEHKEKNVKPTRKRKQDVRSKTTRKRKK